MDLRYGENPHQPAALYGRAGQGIAGAQQLQGKELSYKQPGGSGCGVAVALRIRDPAVAIIKHHKSVRLRRAGDAGGGVAQALECDPVSAYGGRGWQSTG